MIISNVLLYLSLTDYVILVSNISSYIIGYTASLLINSIYSYFKNNN